jgi:hypothetical protein
MIDLPYLRYYHSTKEEAQGQETGSMSLNLEV